MNTKLMTFLLWFVALLITLAFIRYQRATGPTYPIDGDVNIGETVIDFELPRSYGGEGGAEIEIYVPDKSIKARINYRRYKSYDEWSEDKMLRKGDTLAFELPKLAPAGKMQYHIYLKGPEGAEQPLTEEEVILRYKGGVPDFILGLHIVFIFSAFLFSMRTLIEAFLKRKNTAKLALWTFILLTIGGLILGPIIQLYAFGALWTGWPFGHDLTDNKTLVAWIMWLVAFIMLRRKPDKQWWAVLAGIVLIGVYLIPHSVLGSEIDYRKIPQEPAQGNMYDNDDGALNEIHRSKNDKLSIAGIYSRHLR
ncbi:MAG: hypothetical protein ACOC2K_01140 [Bacteroidota bacterium]